LQIVTEIFDLIAICGIQHGKKGGGAHQQNEEPQPSQSIQDSI
jgi:hypothetical protein